MLGRAKGSYNRTLIFGWQMATAPLSLEISDFDVLGRLVCEESASSPHFACGFVSIPLRWSLFGSYQIQFLRISILKCLIFS
ncbi:hypothetical protein L6164_025963 [Bauhinia variegata]|uniref:Uncharacterized protein n=1 Tax=Bauhinia variegata TaxID=167791 RepID=A0ACB9M2A5_BAUVA|nr:hypothetical protein L6164_025963 [Bauhinia variegata]